MWPISFPRCNRGAPSCCAMRPALLCAILIAGAHADLASPPPPGATGCSFWCTRGDGGSDISRCAHPECKLCPVCSAAKACEPTTPRDISHESCEPWCNSQHHTEHCTTCACKSCGWCGSAGGGALQPSAAAPKGDACAPVAHDDGKFQSCKGYCQEKHASTHCKRCDCQSCNFCQAAGGALAPAAPRTPASSNNLPPDSGRACTRNDANDLPYEACSKWCKPEHRGSHCSACACKSCAFCGGSESPGESIGIITSGGGGQCTASSHDDGGVESCKGYCSEKHASAHCTRCDCKACGFCSAQRTCSPHDAADSSVEACESFCLAGRAKDHCPLCRCKRCGFCVAGGQVRLPTSTALLRSIDLAL